MTKIKSDEKGLFVITGGWVGRPNSKDDHGLGMAYKLKISSFKVGDEVKAHHFGGSQIIGVGDINCNFRKRRSYEIWWIDCLSPEVKKVMTDAQNRKLQR
jgi:hypothetical protein